MTPPVKIRRHQVVYGPVRKTGWRWECRRCPPIKGRRRGGFHRDRRWIDLRNPGRYPKAWDRCLRAVSCHVHATHRGFTADWIDMEAT